MSQLEKQIAEKIRAIANGRAGDRFPVMSGKVVAGSVDENEGTCKVVLSVNDTDCPTEDILISAVVQNANGFILYPRDESNVWVAEVDVPGKYGIIKCSNIYKAVVMMNAESGGDKVITMTDNVIETRMGNYWVDVTSSSIALHAYHSTLTGTETLWRFNSGSNGGLVKVVPMTTAIVRLQAEVNTLKTLLTAAIAGMTTAAIPAGGTTPVTASILLAYFSPFASFAGSTITVNVLSDFEDTAVTH
jgi:hypothetical protein